MSIQLRKYQEDSVHSILEEFTKSDSILFQMPTGTGKTTIFSEIIKIWSTTKFPNQRILILVHRKELVTQIIDRLRQFGILAGRIQSGYLNNILLQIQVGLIQSLNNPTRLPYNLSLIIIDEAHHTPSKSYRNILKHYSSSSPKILGVTATPYRLSGETFAELFDKLIVSKSIKEFIKEGWLIPIKHLATSFNDFSNVRIKNKEYVEKDLEVILRSEKVMAELVESYFKYGEDKKAIIFALNKSHSKDIVERFKSEKISAEFIDSDTAPNLRDEIVNKFKNGEIKILCNVNIFTEGFDCPDVELVLLARPTKSFSLYLQQVGRVMRTNEGKTHGLILDNASLWLEHGLVTQDIKWSLNGKLTKYNTVPKVIKNNKPVSIDGMLPTEILGLELIEIQDENETLEEIVEDISSENNIEPIYPVIKLETRIVNLALKLKITTTEIINQLDRLYRIAGENHVFNSSSKINYLLQEFIEVKYRNKINDNSLTYHELTFSFNSFYFITKDIVSNIINFNENWTTILNDRIIENEVLNDLGYYIDEYFFKFYNIPFDKSTMYRDALSILLLIDSVSISETPQNHYADKWERHHYIKDYEFLKDIEINNYKNMYKTIYYSYYKSYNLNKKEELIELIDSVNDYFNNILASICTKLSISELKFEEIKYPTD